MSSMYAVLGLLCWAVSSVESFCYSCVVPNCYRCSCYYVLCFECESGYTLSSHNSCVNGDDDGDGPTYIPYRKHSASSEPSASSGTLAGLYGDDEAGDDEADDDEADEGGARILGWFIGIFVASACLLAVICVIARCRLRQIRAAYASQSVGYSPHGFQGQNYPSAPPIVPYSGQGSYADTGSSTQPLTSNPLPNDPTTTLSDSRG